MRIGGFLFYAYLDGGGVSFVLLLGEGTRRDNRSVATASPAAMRGVFVYPVATHTNFGQRATAERRISETIRDVRTLGTGNGDACGKRRANSLMINEVNETLRLAAQLDTITLVLVVVLVGMVALAAVVVVLLRGRNKHDEQTSELNRLRVEMERALADAQSKREAIKAEMERALLEAQSKRENASLGVVSQLAAQNEILMSTNQQTLSILEQISAREAKKDEVIDRWSKGIEMRNQVQDKQTLAVEANTKAVGQIGASIASALAPQLELAFANQRQTLIQDAGAFVDGLKTEAAGPMAIIRSIPDRLDRHEQRMEALVDTIPGKSVELLAKELRDVSTHLMTIARRLTGGLLISDELPPQGAGG